MRITDGNFLIIYEIIFKCLAGDSLLLLIFLLGCLLLRLVLPGQLPLGVDEVEDHHQHHEDDDDVLTLPRHVFGHPGVEPRLDCLDLLPNIVYKAHSGGVFTFQCSQSEMGSMLVKTEHL